LETEYKNHINYGEFYFPQEINTTLKIEQYSILEKIIYNNIIFNDTLPEEIKNFEIPEGVEIEEIRW